MIRNLDPVSASEPAKRAGLEFLLTELQRAIPLELIALSLLVAPRVTILSLADVETPY